MEKYLPFIGQLIVQHLFQQHMQNLSDLFPLGNAQCKKISAAYGKIFYTQAGVFCQQLFQEVFRRSPLCFTPFQHAVCLSGIICPFQRKQAAYLCLTKLCMKRGLSLSGIS